jgi:hypothetical protein
VRARRHRNTGLPTPEDLDMSDFESDAGVPPKPAPGGMDDNHLRNIYDSYVRAKKECNESVEGLTFDHVANRIRDQVPELLKQANGRRIDFKVAIKDGKAVLRAVAGE